MRTGGAVRAVLSLAVVLAVLAFPPVARAHATVVSSNPSPGERLAAAPGLVVMAFTEPINSRLSRAAVVAPDGQRFQGAASGDRELQVRLSTDAPGVYAVEWTTVSLVDGHTLRGAFAFGVGVAPGGEEAAGETATGPGPLDLLVAVARALEYAGLLAAGGMLLHRHLARRPGGLGWVRPQPWPPLALALASGCAVVLGEALAASPAWRPRRSPSSSARSPRRWPARRWSSSSSRWPPPATRPRPLRPGWGSRPTRSTC